MKHMKCLFKLICIIYCLCSCETSETEYKKGDITIFIEQGKEWKHDFPLFWGITKKNSPQMAIWIEDICGNYISTIYVTKRIATQSWLMAGKNRRKEALPHWCHSRGILYEDNLYLPTKERPVPDAVTGATPHGSFRLNYSHKKQLDKFIVKVEVNHSTDFNEYFPQSALKGEKNYSGGNEGSGQPALVYYAEIDMASCQKTFVATLIGHSSPDGKDGNVYSDLSGITSALSIIERIKIEICK